MTIQKSSIFSWQVAFLLFCFKTNNQDLTQYNLGTSCIRKANFPTYLGILNTNTTWVVSILRYCFLLKVMYIGSAVSLFLMLITIKIIVIWRLWERASGLPPIATDVNLIRESPSLIYCNNYIRLKLMGWVTVLFINNCNQFYHNPFF